MNAQALKRSPSSTEDDVSDEERESEGRRRRLCIERKQEHEAQTSPRPANNYKRPRIYEARQRPNQQSFGYSHQRRPFQGQTSRRQRSHLIPVTMGRQPSKSKPKDCIAQTSQEASMPSLVASCAKVKLNKPTISEGSNSSNQTEPKEPVIYINPRFVQRFVDKSMQLSSNNSSAQHLGTETNVKMHRFSKTFNSKSKMIESANNGTLLDVNSIPVQSLQAASAMVVVRLVTECIQNNSKRDERLNKVIAARLVDAIKQKHVDESVEAM